MFGVFASLKVLSVSVSSYRLARSENKQGSTNPKATRQNKYFSKTYISTCVDPELCGKGNLSGLDQAMNPKMKIKTKPALHANANMGLRAPVEGSIISRSCACFPLQI